LVVVELSNEFVSMTKMPDVHRVSANTAPKNLFELQGGFPPNFIAPVFCPWTSWSSREFLAFLDNDDFFARRFMKGRGGHPLRQKNGRVLLGNAPFVTMTQTADWPQPTGA